jgi:AcrR family transcriptional regulator
MSEATAQYFQEISGGERKRSRTRAFILDTAITIFAEKGFASGLIAEIAQAAGLSNGAFYYHFKDKTSLLETVGGAVAATLVAAVDDAISEIELGPQRVAVATMLFARRGVSEPSWGPLVIQALNEMGEFREQISRRIRKDVRIGIRQGFFSIKTSQPLFDLLLGIVATSMRSQIDSGGKVDGVALAADAILRVLGLSPDAAASEVKAAAGRLQRLGEQSGRCK